MGIDNLLHFFQGTCDDNLTGKNMLSLKGQMVSCKSGNPGSESKLRPLECTVIHSFPFCFIPVHFIPGPEVIKLFSCSTQLSMRFFLLINVKMPTIVGILTIMIGKNSILCLSEPKMPYFLIFLDI